MGKNTITICIPTCYSGNSLVETVESIRRASYGENVKIVITADRTPIKKEIKAKLEKLNAEVFWNEKEGSQFKKIKQMIKKSNSDIYISTQDDVIFDKNTILEVHNAFQKDSNLTMAAIRILPLKPLTFFENAMTSMLRIVDSISQNWKSGDNYLAASGRCLAFKTSHLKKFRIPETVVNGDMFLYLENQRLNGKFKRLEKAIVYIRCPQKIEDQIGPSSRHLYSSLEMKKYFNWNLENEYEIPVFISTKAFILEFLRNPIASSYYLVIRIYTRILKLSKKEVSSPIWKIDTSTK